MKPWTLVGAVCWVVSSLAFASDGSTPPVDQEAVTRLLDYTFTRTGADADKAGIRTDGLLVLKGGKVLIERYDEAGGFDAATPHITWSMSKSALNALVGTAVQAGRLSLDDLVATYVPALKRTAPALKVRDLLELSSCLTWSESYEGADFTQSTVLAMLYGTGKRDMGAFAAARPPRCAPGSRWSYSSGDTVILSEVLRAVYGDAYAALPWTALFEPLGMDSAVWETDKTGTFVTSSYLYATPRDLAKLGELFLQGGVWNGQRLLPEGWVQYSTSPAKALLHATEQLNPADGVGGALWWTNIALPEKGVPASWPSAPADLYAALGHWGQGLYVIPSLDMVIVRTADDRDGTFNEDQFLRLVLAAVKAPTRAFTAAPKHSSDTPYWRIPGLSSAFVAKEMCSCLFVIGRNEEQCAVYASQSPMLATYTIDWDGKGVRAALRYGSIGGFGLYPAQALYRGEREGCALQ